MKTSKTLVINTLIRKDYINTPDTFWVKVSQFEPVAILLDIPLLAFKDRKANLN